MKIRYDVISDVGRKRTNNEDMALIFGSQIRDNALRSAVPMGPQLRFTAIVADGMGGYGGGEIASEIATSTFSQYIDSMPEGLDDDQVKEYIKRWFEFAQNHIFVRQSEPGLSHMGTTVTGIFTYDNRFYMINAGDSRVYRLRYETLRQLTKDHSERERWGGDPKIPSNLIYNALGVPNGFVDVTALSEEAPVVDGDVYVVCSDGLSDMIDDKTIEQILNNGGGTRQLVDAALEAGGADNCTVIVFSVEMPADDKPEEAIQSYATEPMVHPTVVTHEPTQQDEIGFQIDEPGARVEDEAPKQEPVQNVPPMYVPQQYEETLKELEQSKPIQHPEAQGLPESQEPVMQETFRNTVEIEPDGVSVDDSDAEPHEQSRLETAGKLLKELGSVLFGKRKK